MDQQQATFEHLQQSIERIESRQASQHENMMAYLHSMFPPPLPQPWVYLEFPFSFFFMLPKREKYLGSRRPSCISLSYLSWLAYMLCFRVHVRLPCIYIYTWYAILMIHVSYPIFHALHCFLLITSLPNVSILYPFGHLMNFRVYAWDS